MVFGFSRAGNAVKHRHAVVLLRQYFAEWFSDELIRGLIHHAAKGGIDIVHDVPASLDRGHRQGCVIEAQARQLWFESVCFHKFGSFLYFVAFGSGAVSFSCAWRGPVRWGIPVVNPS